MHERQVWVDLAINRDYHDPWRSIKLSHVLISARLEPLRPEAAAHTEVTPLTEGRPIEQLLVNSQGYSIGIRHRLGKHALQQRTPCR